MEGVRAPQVGVAGEGDARVRAAPEDMKQEQCGIGWILIVLQFLCSSAQNLNFVRWHRAFSEIDDSFLG